MKFLNDYQKFFQSINEQETKEKPAATPKPAAVGDVPDWFQKGFYDASKAKKGKLGSKLTMDPKDLQTTYNFVKKLQQISKKEFANVKELQQYLWSQKDLKECEPLQEGGDKRTLEQALNDFRKDKGIQSITPEKFMDGLYGAQTNMFLNTLICVLDKLNKIELQPMEIKIATLGAIPDSAPLAIQQPKIDTSKTVGAGEISRKFDEEGTTGLTPEELKQKAETIMNDSLIPDESESKDKFKLGANKMGARIVYKDKGAQRLGPDELAILDEFFLTDGFVRTKSKEKGGIFRDKFMKYVWVKKLNPGSSEAKAALDDFRDKKKNPPKQQVEPLEPKQAKLQPTPKTEPSA